jgi:putative secretion ATPase (PEP-CTERM system associated)
MFETHFGLRAPPFQLVPDPAFLYGSRGHRQALAYLKYGVAQQEGFIVVTGEVGAGKTTTVRALMQTLDPAQIIAAQIVNTQVNDVELLGSICAAFGIPRQGESKAQLLSTLEAFLLATATRGRRALLIVDEAQNLGRRELEELRMLSNFQLGNQALLQSFLVGQPELRATIGSPEMAQFRQRVIASCHLGHLSPEETGDYVAHRLKHAGHAGEPIFDAEALAGIHVATGGVPRRINVLCSRLLLSAYLESELTVSAQSVAALAADLGNEFGMLGVAPTN